MGHSKFRDVAEHARRAVRAADTAGLVVGAERTQWVPTGGGRGWRTGGGAVVPMGEVHACDPTTKRAVCDAELDIDQVWPAWAWTSASGRCLACVNALAEAA